MEILIVEDDGAISEWLRKKFTQEGHACHVVDSGERALEEIGSRSFDAVILDRMLPGIDGIDVLRQLQGKPHPPVLILSTIDLASERVIGLRAGAQDYMGKPFHFPELLVRIEMIARRGNDMATPSPLSVHIQDLHIDLLHRKVTRAGQRIELTDKEYLLLCTLAEHGGRTVPRAMLLEKVWGLQFDPHTNLIDVHVSKLRSKIDRDFRAPLLKTVRALGYALG
jgi:two-component system OmpR family response regulator